MLLQKEPRRQEHVFVVIDDQDFTRSVIHDARSFEKKGDRRLETADQKQKAEEKKVGSKVFSSGLDKFG
jgi:hypothetical protein